MIRKYSSLIVLLTLLGGAWSPESPAGTGCVDQTFPSGGPAQTRWQVCYQTLTKYGLAMQKAAFQKSPAAQLLPVFTDARIVEISVPYASGSPIVRDMGDNTFSLVSSLLPGECPGETITTDSGILCKEIRDRGIAWKRHKKKSRRGEELVIWSVLQAGNYNYIIEYRFTDEGTIETNVGSTGPKLNGRDDKQGHVHNFTWRFDIDLNGPDGDTVYKTSYDDKRSLSYSEIPITEELGFNWVKNFRKIGITDSTIINGNGHQTAYELQCDRLGIERNASPKLDFLQKDYWVTAFHNFEIGADKITTYVNNESLQGANIVIWYTVSAPHEHNMRDEDRETVPVKWVGCRWQPRNLFDRTPFYQD